MMKKALVTAVLPGLLLLFLAGCVDSESVADETNDRVAHLLERGKSELAAGNYYSAEDTFGSIIEELDENNNEAHYGRVLARVMHFWSLFDFLIKMVVDPSNLADSALLRLSPQQEEITAEEMVTEVLMQAVTDLRDRMASIENDVAFLQQSSPVLFTIEHFPIEFLGLPLLDLGGQFGDGELALIGGCAGTLASILYIVAAHDFSFDFTTVWYDLTSGAVGETLPELLGFVASILRDNPTFLGLRDDAADQASLAADYLTQAADDFASLDALLAANAGNTESILAVEYEDEEGALVVRNLYAETGSHRVLWHNEQYSLRDVSNAFKVNVDSGEAIPVGDFLLSLLVFVDLMGKSIGFNELLGSFGLGSDVLPFDLSLITGDDPGTLPSLAMGLIAGYLPYNLLALDPAGFLSHPTGLRNLLPQLSPLDREGYDGFLLSYECPIIALPEADYAAGDSIAVEAYDRFADSSAGPNNDALTLTVAILDADDSIIDEESIIANEDAAVDALFDCTIVTAADASTAPISGNDVLSIGPSAVSLQIGYGSVSRKIDVGTGDGFSAWGSFSCNGDATDLPHFGDSYYASLTQIGPDGNQSSLSEISADGVAGVLPYIPFVSPSFGGLIHIDPQQLSIVNSDISTGEQAGPATLKSFNLLIQAYASLF